MAGKLTYDDCKKQILAIIDRPKQTAPAVRRGILTKLIERAKAKRAGV